MTVSELYKSVAQLGFEESLEDDGRFFFSANRALLQVNALRPRTSVCLINHKPLENKVSEASFLPIEKTEDLFFEASDVKSYTFEADGNGTVYIERYDEASSRWVKIGMETLSSVNQFVLYRGFIKDGDVFVKGRVRLVFTGDYLYSVRNVAMYGYLYSPSAEDIPRWEAYCPYDISKLASDFLSLASPPIREDPTYDRLNQGYEVLDGRIILLQHNANGLYTVVYNRKPQTIVDDGDVAYDTTAIDLDEDLCALLPLLIASFIWADDEPEKAQYYLSVYRERAADLERRITSVAPVAIKNIYGW